uniref:Cytoplasmic dynein 2 light intermediate chain 1 n=1 Tax=Clastoptera arizonana TaxID=38151 RepID=A0A1B6E536_9HEMI
MIKSLREIAVEKSKEDKTPISDYHANEKTIIFVGNRNVGKTTLINHFLDKNEATKKTLALEYTFARRSGKSLKKDVCHIWELGTLNSTLLASTRTLTKSSKTTLVLMLDLSDLGNVWSVMENLLNTLKSTIQATHDQSSGQDALLKRIPNDHPDKEKFDPFPIPLVIVGGKYDLFQIFEPEKKRVVCRCLRFVAHRLCATLAFYSSKDASLVKRLRDLLSHHAFGTPPVKTISQDYSKPLMVTSGSDLFDSIEGVASASTWTLEKVKHLFTSHFTQESSKAQTLLEDPAKDPNFREPTIDALRRQKDEELERYCLEVQRREQILLAK